MEVVNMINLFYIGLYLIAIVLANLLTTWFGPSISVVNAFLLIALDLTSRDKLHDAWHGQGLVWKMTLLILSGSLLSWAINRSAGPIAVASFIAFALANISDAITYQLLKDNVKLLKVNGSNIVSAAVDSIVFPGIAFGLPLLWGIVIGQFLAKVFGGFIWSLILNRKDLKSLNRFPPTA